ncbi:glycosyltransferase family 39 protein, partial [Candidatus Nomurabacteria bacterium]|nr:glycosyltransferase family 39 protein [Candidatus Nomurabacteria bacterium]
MSLKKDPFNILIIVLFVLFLTLPFANKAVHIDDIVFLYISNQITKEPLKPYSFNLEWSTLSGLATHITDPPLISYYAALITVLFGESKLVLHTSYIIFPLLAGVSMYYISKKFTQKPLFPTLFLITSATFVVMSHNFMLDIPFLALFLASLCFYIYGVDSKNNYLIILGAIFCGLAFLTKYSGLILLPILDIYSFLKKNPKSLLYLSIPATIILAWNLYTFKLYGVPHSLQIFYYMLGSQSYFLPKSVLVRLITNF